MAEAHAITTSSFREKLEGLIEEMGPKRLELSKEYVREFCELTGHDYDEYRKRGDAPAGILMSFTDPMISGLFVNFFVKYPGAIKGVVHSTSKIDFLRPISLSQTGFEEKLAVGDIREKSGKKGNYLVVNIEMTLYDNLKRKVAVDLHTFFVRV